MAEEQLTHGVSPYKIDWPFNAWLVVILTLAYGCLVAGHHKPLLLAVLLTTATILLLDRTSTWHQTFALLVELPLGLGSVLAFLSAPPSFRARHHRSFAACVNLLLWLRLALAVLAVPAEATFRGWCGRVAGSWLLASLVQKARHRGSWAATTPHDDANDDDDHHHHHHHHRGRLLVFSAVGPGWVLAHAVYRYILRTLPATYGAGHRLRLLDGLSLGMAGGLGRAARLEWARCWVMADVLVGGAAAAWSAVADVFDLLPGMEGEGVGFDVDRDLFLAGLQLSVALVAAAGMFEAWVEKSVEDEKREKARNPQPPQPRKAAVATGYEFYEV
ncbi:hypothetical protein ISF_05960 [Cordyceps fumosorosea ARSEF 2679]|uniref:Uncharacterized protein n=1 Tax=Cordyceps fumosorosea (strain ARSEF 2679) TaxID=1081104 RepID=A0A167SUY4_CORFA|nr:hypothetical protein ISF_05960 [Cordyceps fumosorosea ARSEF 2679]OAA59949.1 hypothetical protein ISF_05960 [Cordyceps fumosorosea ARSEF 2679]